MTEPLVSIKMITYNHAPYIAQAIEGVLQQKVNFPIELVIGEDCSTDGTREVVFEYQKKYPDIIRVITSDKNVGMHKNGYRTMKACRGKYIAYCEGDDYWHDKQKLANQIEIFLNDQNVGLVHSNCRFELVRERRIIEDYYKAAQKTCNNAPADVLPEKLIDMSYSIITCTVCVKKSLIERGMKEHPELFSDIYPFGDLQQWFCAALYCKVVFLPQVLATRRVLDESASYTNNFNKAIEFVKSEFDFRIYCTRKFRLGENTLKRLEDARDASLLWLSFCTGNQVLGKESYKSLKKNSSDLSWKQKIIYLSMFDKKIMHTFQNFYFLMRKFFPKTYVGH